MTDFLSWWADHWPLVPIIALYPWYALKIWAFGDWLKRRREP